MPEIKTKSTTTRRSDDQFFAQLGSFMRSGSQRATDCPSEEDVIEEALGGLPATRSASVRKHLSGCQSCFDESLAVALAVEGEKRSPVPTGVPLALRRAIENQAIASPSPWWKSLWEQGAVAFDRAVALALDAIFPEPVTAILAHAAGSHQAAEAKSGKQLRVRVPVKKKAGRDAAGMVTLPCAITTKDATLTRINGFLAGEGRYAMAALAARPGGWDLALEPAVFRKAKRIDPGDARHLLVIVGTRIRDVEEAAGELRNALARKNTKSLTIQPRIGVAYIVYSIKG